MSLQDDRLYDDSENLAAQPRVLRIEKDWFDRASSIAVVIATLGALWAAVAATGAWWASRAEANAANRAAIAEESTARVEAEAPLAIQCPAPHKAFSDGVWSFQSDGKSYFREGAQPIRMSSTVYTCGITNYGRIPALLVRPHFSYIRTRNGLCDLMKAQFDLGSGKAAYAKLNRFKDLPILGIAAGSTYTIAFEADTDDFIFVALPDTVSYQTPTEAQPTDKSLIGRGAKGFPTSEGFSLEKRMQDSRCFNYWRQRLSQVRPQR